jgi:hypothetical protein
VTRRFLSPRAQLQYGVSEEWRSQLPRRRAQRNECRSKDNSVIYSRACTRVHGNIGASQLNHVTLSKHRTIVDSVVTRQQSGLEDESVLLYDTSLFVRNTLLSKGPKNDGIGEKEKERIRERQTLEQKEGALEAVGYLAGSRPTRRKGEERREGEKRLTAQNRCPFAKRRRQYQI